MAHFQSQESDGTKGPVIIGGIKAEDPARPPLRIEIRDLQKDKYSWNLYLLGLQRFQEVAENKPLSWQKIAGIHGLPFDRWPIADWNHMEEVTETGFCTHTSILFLPWHRPYLALFETELYKHVNDVAKEFTEEEGGKAYVEAAKRFRIPYWDWARPDLLRFPEATFQTSRPEITRPKSQPKPGQNPNPLGAYLFKDPEGVDKEFTIGKYKSTVRYPKLKGGNESDEAMLEALDAFYKIEKKPGVINRNLTERTLWILQSYQTFKSMSNNALSSLQAGFQNYGSFEDSHNFIHNLTGAGGHMGATEIAAYDPLFWLHHANIDRLWTIWQDIHGRDDDAETYVTSAKSIHGTYTTEVGGTEDQDTSLTPFYKSETKFWTAKDVKDTKTFGYAYPETQSWNYANRDAYIAALRKQLVHTYRMGSLANLIRASPEEYQAQLADLKERAKMVVHTAKGGLGEAVVEQLENAALKPSIDIVLPSDRSPKELVVDKRYTEWLVNVKHVKHTLNGRAAVHVFLGDVDDSQPQLYEVSQNYVGGVVAFGQDDATGCVKCQKDRLAGQEITGQVPLTIALVERYLAGDIGSLSPGEVVSYLQKHLHWRTATVEGVRCDRNQVEGLLVAVVSNGVTVPDDPYELPIYDAEVIPWPDATTRLGDEEGGAGRGAGTGLTQSYLDNMS